MLTLTPFCEGDAECNQVGQDKPNKRRCISCGAWHNREDLYCRLCSYERNLEV